MNSRLPTLKNVKCHESSRKLQTFKGKGDHLHLGQIVNDFEAESGFCGRP